METKLPKFEVGEVVILVSNDYPHLNGEYTIHDIGTVITDGCATMGGIDYHFQDAADGNYIYSLGLDLLNTGRPSAVNEQVLRKKHQPGTMSFTELMSSLNVPKMEKV